MAINKKLIHFQNKTNFLNKLEAGEILDTSIVFIRDAKQIWTHGELYSCPYTEEEINQLFVGSNIKLTGYAEIDGPVTILATDTVNDAFGKIEDYLSGISELNAILVDTGDAALDPIINDYITSGELSTELQNYVTDSELTSKGYATTSYVKTEVANLESVKQDKLVSGTNIKTINGTSILGSGDITISGGSGGTSSGGSGAYAEVNHGTSDTTFTLTPNTFHVWDEVASLDLSFGAETSGVTNEYLFQFTSGATATTLTLPDGIKWANEPTIAENMIYQISVLKGLASVLEFSNAAALITFYVGVGGTEQLFQCEPGMTWQDFVNSEYNQGQYVLSISGNNVAWNSFYISDQVSTDMIVAGSKYQTYYND